MFFCKKLGVKDAAIFILHYIYIYIHIVIGDTLLSTLNTTVFQFVIGRLTFSSL